MLELKYLSELVKLTKRNEKFKISRVFVSWFLKNCKIPYGVWVFDIKIGKFECRTKFFQNEFSLIFPVPDYFELANKSLCTTLDTVSDFPAGIQALIT